MKPKVAPEKKERQGISDVLKKKKSNRKTYFAIYNFKFPKTKKFYYCVKY